MKLVDLFSKANINMNINALHKKIEKDSYHDEILQRFNEKIEEFLKSYMIEEIDDFIQFSYLHFVNLYLYQKKEETGRNKKTLQEFLNVCRRIIELYIFIESKKLLHMKEKFFKIHNYDDCIYKHFINISSKITNEDICIEYLKKGKNKRIFLNDYYFKMSSMPIIFNLINKSNTHFKQIFKLENYEINAVFNATLAKNTELYSSKKGKLSKRSNLDIHIFTNESEYSNKSISKNSSNESVLDFQNNNKQKKSAYFKDYNITTKDIKKYKTNSKYKQHLMDKAISSQLTKNSMFLKSSYLFPHIEHLKLFVKEARSVLNNERIMILCSIFSGIKIKDLIYAFLDIHNKLDYLSNRKILKVKISKDIYALKRTQTVEIHLHEEVDILFNILYQYFKDQKSELTNNTVEVFVEKEIENIKKEFNSCLKKLNKTVKFTFNNIHKCLRFYYNQFHKNSDVSILFHIDVNQSDKAKLCYVQQLDRLLNLELWISEFYSVLANEFINLKTIEETKKIGSPFFIENSDFKSFIDEIDNLYLKNKDTEIRFNLKMVFIRYSLSLLLATRDFKNSCDLMHYSRRFNILTIQEKAKNIKTAKRIIPISDFAKEIIDLFYQTRNEFDDCKCYSPMLYIDNKFEDITQKSVEKYFKKICTKEEQDVILKFIKNCKLNFGRHVFSTLIRKENINKDYENGFLGHFFLGNSDQGIYSNFNNKKCHKVIVDFIENKIVSNYFPTKIFILENK